MARRCLFAILLSLVCTGLVLAACSERLAYDTPYLHTRVVDSDTGLPIANVRVAVWNRDNPLKQAMGLSDRDGYVLVPPVTHEIWVFGPWDPIPPDGKARFEAPGYAVQEIDVDGGVVEAAPVALTPMK